MCGEILIVLASPALTVFRIRPGHLHQVSAEFGRHSGRIIDGVKRVFSALLANRGTAWIRLDDQRHPITLGVLADNPELLEVIGLAR